MEYDPMNFRKQAHVVDAIMMNLRSVVVKWDLSLQVDVISHLAFGTPCMQLEGLET
jgi:hypothetical protein